MRNKINLPGFTGERSLFKINSSYRCDSDGFSKLHALRELGVIPQMDSLTAACKNAGKTKLALQFIGSVFGSWLDNTSYQGLLHDNAEFLSYCNSMGMKVL